MRLHRFRLHRNYESLEQRRLKRQEAWQIDTWSDTVAKVRFCSCLLSFSLAFGLLFWMAGTNRESADGQTGDNDAGQHLGSSTFQSYPIIIFATTSLLLCFMLFLALLDRCILGLESSCDILNLYVFDPHLSHCLKGEQRSSSGTFCNPTSLPFNCMGRQSAPANAICNLHDSNTNLCRDKYHSGDPTSLHHHSSHGTTPYATVSTLIYSIRWRSVAWSPTRLRKRVQLSSLMSKEVGQ